MRNHMLFTRCLALIILIFALGGLGIMNSGCQHEKDMGVTAGFGSLEEGMVPEGVSGEESAPAGIVEITPADRSSITDTQEIVIIFSKSMDVASLALSGDLGGEADAGVWSMSASPNDTLTISPAAKWTAGTKTLSVQCSSSSGSALPEIKLTYGVNVVYVKAGESGVGTMDDAMGNISDAITKAFSEFPLPSQVHVAQGIYEVETGSTNIYMKEGVSLYGGLSPADWLVRDPSAYPTVIEDTISVGGDDIVNNPNCAVRFESPISNVTVIDGFKIHGGGGEAGIAICVRAGAAPTISNNILRGNNAKMNLGILNMGPSLIFSNDIKGGGTKMASGVYNIFSGNSKIYNNTIVGGDGAQVAVAIASHGSSPIIHSNVIKGGTAVLSANAVYNVEGTAATVYNNIIDAGIGQGTNGVREQKSLSKIFNNTINGGTASNTSVGINIANDTQPVIDNNIVFTYAGTKRFGIYEDGLNSEPLEVRNNDIFDCNTALYRDADVPVDLQNIAAMEANLTGDGVLTGGNVDDIPVFVSTDDRHLAETTPQIIKTGGLDGAAPAQNWGFTKDKDGVERVGNGSTGWSMGAYQYIQ